MSLRVDELGGDDGHRPGPLPRMLGQVLFRRRSRCSRLGKRGDDGLVQSNCQKARENKDEWVTNGIKEAGAFCVLI